uniref:Clathrin light chain n=1 Tax=Panagrellus redivivus TaxID=6233 RepID=A0A7E4VA15_PANRE
MSSSIDAGTFVGALNNAKLASWEAVQRGKEFAEQEAMRERAASGSHAPLDAINAAKVSSWETVQKAREYAQAEALHERQRKMS